ncbi:hypothetical protein ACHMWU_28265 [Aeromicrobium sp. UC242_57]
MRRAEPQTRHPGAYAVWAVALAVYLLAVFHRSSLGVAGLAATERFDIQASASLRRSRCCSCWSTRRCRFRSAC